jgi:hypothetical protein
VSPRFHATADRAAEADGIAFFVLSAGLARLIMTTGNVSAHRTSRHSRMVLFGVGGPTGKFGPRRMILDGGWSELRRAA